MTDVRLFEFGRCAAFFFNLANIQKLTLQIKLELV